jgi:GTP-binding protein
VTDVAEAGRATARERGRLLFAQDCRFVAGVTGVAALPPAGLPEVAFAGRSNVGKSSLINALTGRRTLARISHTPGRTQQLNFFELGGRLMLVDLPGYGYAKASKTKVEHWNKLTEDYLRGRPTLRRLCLLIDARHGLLAADRATIALLDKAAVSYQLVLTKVDKTGGSALARLVASLEAETAGHGAAHPEIIATSSLDQTGIPALRAALADLAAPDHP